jgi:hypothetical protein
LELNKIGPQCKRAINTYICIEACELIKPITKTKKSWDEYSRNFRNGLKSKLKNLLKSGKTGKSEDAGNKIATGGVYVAINGSAGWFGCW